MFSPKLHHFDIVDSTNDVAMDLALRGEPEFTVVTADRQLDGRGRRGRPWWDEPGQSVLMSVVLAPDRPLGELPQLSFVASLAAARCLDETYGLGAALKWPNDVLIGDKKIAGMLVELAPGENAFAVVGIGLNVNQLAFPREIAGFATSLAIETGRCWSVDEVMLDLLDCLQAAYEEYLEQGFSAIRLAWGAYMWGAGKNVEVATEDGSVSGKMMGIDEAGALLVKSQGGEMQAIHAADSIRIVPI